MKQKLSFTLLELLLTLSIILVLCSIAVPYLIQRTHNNLDHELDRLETVFYYLQQRAIATNMPQELLFDPIAHTYSFIKNKQLVTHKLPWPLHFGSIPTALGPPGNPTAPVTKALTFPVHPSQKRLLLARLLPNGKISPGAAYISDKEKNELGALTCSISQVSYIRKYRYKSNGWILLTA